MHLEVEKKAYSFYLEFSLLNQLGMMVVFCLESWSEVKYHEDCV